MYTFIHAKTKPINRLLVFLLVISLFCSLPLPVSAQPDSDARQTDVTTEAAGNVMIQVDNLTALSDDQQKLLNRINEIRKEACDEGMEIEFRKGTGNKTKLTPDMYVPIQWSSQLEEIALTRAVEANLTMAHLRTNGANWNEISFTDEEGNRFLPWSEILAWGTPQATCLGDSIENWYSEKQNFDSTKEQVYGGETGHYEALVNPQHIYIGLAGVYSPNTLYPTACAGILSNGSIYTTPAEMDKTQIKRTGPLKQLLEVKPDTLSNLYITGPADMMKCGEQADCSVYAGETTYNSSYGPSTYKNARITSAITWSSDDESVAFFTDDGRLTASQAGTTTIRGEFAGLSVSKTIQVSDESMTRVYGSNRFKTSQEIALALLAQTNQERFGTVILTSGTNFADAMSGSYLASLKKAPILLVSEADPASTAQFLKDHMEAGGTVYILGGTGAVSENAEAVIRGSGFSNIKRLGGRNRYMTNLMILNEAASAEGADFSDIMICSGNDFPDALSASAIKKPILLTSGRLREEQKEALPNLYHGGRIWLIGGSGAVSEEIYDDLAGIATDTVVRVSGKNRFETSRAIAQSFFGEKTDQVVLTYGMAFPDALCAGPLASAVGAPMLLATDLPNHFSAAAGYTQEKNSKNCITIGGPALISDNTVKTIMHK